MEPKGDIAVIGLAVMGQNLILNMNDNGFTVVAFNRTVSKVDDFLAKEAKGTKIVGAHSLAEMAALLKRPRRVMLMVKAGAAVDEFIEQLLPHLEAGDIIIDGGNSLFEDTIRRTKYVESKGLLYIGTGVSGGEEGARRLEGPAPLPAAHAEAHFRDQGLAAGGAAGLGHRPQGAGAARADRGQELARRPALPFRPTPAGRFARSRPASEGKPAPALRCPRGRPFSKGQPASERRPVEAQGGPAEDAADGKKEA